MAKSMMVNFRAPAESVDMYDEAAVVAGMSRSQWLRNAAELALGRFRDGGFTPTANVVRPTSAPRCIDGNFRDCESADWVTGPAGLRTCNTCQIRTKF